MSRLIHKKSQTVLADSIEEARSPWSRMKGLIGKKDFPLKKALWISPCTSIHTFFMKFPIDVIFVDKKLIITSMAYAVLPSRFALGGWSAHSVFEFKANQLKNYNIKKGDELYVDH